MKRKSKKYRRFKMFVKQYDEDGAIAFQRCGWINGDPFLHLVDEYSKAQIFEEHEEGHGSFNDWVELIKEEHPMWNISIKYLN